MVTVWTVELYMVPLALLVLFAYNFSLVTTGKVNNAQDAQASRVAVTFLAAPACPERSVTRFNGIKLVV